MKEERKKIGSIISFSLPTDWDTAENRYVEAREDLEEYDFDKSITDTWPEQVNMWPRWQTAANCAAIDLCCATAFYTDSELARVEKKLSGIEEFQFEDLGIQLFQMWYLRDKATSAGEYFDIESQKEALKNRRYYKITNLCRSLVQGHECAMVESVEVEGHLKKRTYHFIVEKDRTKDADGAEGWKVQELHIMLWSTTENHHYLDKELQQFIDSIYWL